MTRAKDISKIVTDADLSGTLDVAGDLTVDTNTLHVDSANNRVGIGLSSNIDRKLHVEVDNTYAAKFGGTAGGDFAIEIGQTGTSSSAGFNATGTGGAMKFSISGSEAMRIDSSGHLLVGTTTSFNALNGRGDIVVGNGSSNGGMTVFTGSSNQGAIAFADGTSGDQAYRGMVEYDHSTDSMAFKTAVSERMRIGNNGSVAIGSTSTASADRLTLKGSTSDNTTNFLIRNSSDTTLFSIDNNGLLKSVPTNNNTTGSSANMVVFSDGQFARSTSSLRYKNTVNDATHGLTELLTLRPVTYKGNNDGDTIFGGLIAEEVHDAGLTEFVTYNDDDEPDALAYGNMVSLCIKAIQELKAELDSAKARITALENGE